MEYRCVNPKQINVVGSMLYCLFCFLRIGEMVGNAYDPSVNLSLSDVPVDKPKWPTMLKISIKQIPSKMVDLFLGKMNTDICPVRALLNYLIRCGSAQGSLFILEDGSFLTPHYVMSTVRDALQRADVDQEDTVVTAFK